MSAPELQPCPFCGGVKQMVMPPSCNEQSAYDPADCSQPVVRCQSCSAEVQGATWDHRMGTAIAAWNTRTTSEADALRAGLELAILLGQSLGMTDMEVDAIRARAALKGAANPALDAEPATYETCATCAGTGLALNMSGEPDECRNCGGDTVTETSA